MTALSIRHMNFSLRQMELLQWEKDADEYAKLPADRERSSYWFIERKAKRGKNKWIFVRDFRGTKREAAELFCKKFRDGQHRLRHMMKYGA